MSMPKIQIINPSVLKAKRMLHVPRRIWHDTRQHSASGHVYPMRKNACRENKEPYLPQDIRMPGKEPVCRLSTVQASPQWWKWVFLFSNKGDEKKGANNSQFPKTKLRNSTEKEVMTTQTVLALLERSESGCCFRKKFILSPSLSNQFVPRLKTK